MRTVAAVAAVAVISAAAGVGYQLFKGGGVPDRPSASSVVDRIYAVQLADLEGALQRVEQWRGRVLVVNFWATWCAPCREEIPGFVSLQHAHGERGLLFVGIAIDQPDKVMEFAREFQMNYPVLIGDGAALDLLRQSGNRAGVLPYTLVIDRQGNLVHQQPGGVHVERLEAIIKPLI
jgi:thiol-disulfide isomerase/thioredoxin